MITHFTHPEFSRLSCSVERHEADIDAQSYIDGYCHADRFIDYCRQCGNYAKRHGCPPFDYDPMLRLRPYNQVRLLGVKIIPQAQGLSMKQAYVMLKPITRVLNDELLATESEYGGLAFGFVGTCPYCDKVPCARIDGQPCRHPDKVRPSLEAYGFDIMATARDLLGLDILWGKDGLAPPYLTLVCGLFYR